MAYNYENYHKNQMKDLKKRNAINAAGFVIVTSLLYWLMNHVEEYGFKRGIAASDVMMHKVGLDDEFNVRCDELHSKKD